MGWGFGLTPFHPTMNNTTTTMYDTGDDEVTLVKEYKMSDIRKVVDHSKAMASAGMTENTHGDKLVASVHPAVLIAWLNTRGLTMAEFMSGGTTLAKQFLEDPDNSQFRIWRGKI